MGIALVTLVAGVSRSVCSVEGVEQWAHELQHTHTRGEPLLSAQLEERRGPP